MPKQRIIVHIEGNVEEDVQRECATTDSLLDLMSHEISVFVKDNYGYNAYVDDMITIDEEAKA